MPVNGGSRRQNKYKKWGQSCRLISHVCPNKNDIYEDHIQANVLATEWKHELELSGLIVM